MLARPRLRVRGRFSRCLRRARLALLRVRQQRALVVRVHAERVAARDAHGAAPARSTKRHSSEDECVALRYAGHVVLHVPPLVGLRGALFAGLFSLPNGLSTLRRASGLPRVRPRRATKGPRGAGPGSRNKSYPWPAPFPGAGDPASTLTLLLALTLPESRGPSPSPFVFLYVFQAYP